jgi:hypothetical protein
MARGADLLPGFETAGWEIVLRFSPRPQGQDFDAVSGSYTPAVTRSRHAYSRELAVTEHRIVRACPCAPSIY